MAALSRELILQPEALLGPIAFPYKIFDLSHRQMHEISYRQSWLSHRLPRLHGKDG